MASTDLTVRFLGVRGSIATPGEDRKAGGNTRIIIDAGTGLRALGNERMANGPRHSTILLSHLHWDHICGLPFFTPIYVPGHRVEIASGPNGVMPLDAAIRSAQACASLPGTVAAPARGEAASYRKKLAREAREGLILSAREAEHAAAA